MNNTNTDPEMAEARELLAVMAGDTAEIKDAARGSVTDTVANWLAPQYLLAAKEKLRGLTGDDRLAVLQRIIMDWSWLRRGELASARLQLRREQLEWERTNGKLQKEKEFEQWIERPEIRKKYLPDESRGISTETFHKIERELRLL